MCIYIFQTRKSRDESKNADGYKNCDYMCVYWDESEVFLLLLLSCRAKQDSWCLFCELFFSVSGAVRDIISVFVTPRRIFVTQLAIVMMQHFELFVHWSLYLNIAAHFLPPISIVLKFLPDFCHSKCCVFNEYECIKRKMYIPKEKLHKDYYISSVDFNLTNSNSFHNKINL